MRFANGRQALVASAMVCALAAVLHGQVAFDGSVQSAASEEWGAAKLDAVQDNYTGYGDQHLTPGGFPGSELDELYVRTDGTYLYIGLTGNLEQNGNSIILLLETGVNGQIVLASEIAPRVDELPCSANGPPGAVQGLGQALLRNDNATPDDTTDDVTSRDGATTGTKLDAGFAATRAIGIDLQCIPKSSTIRASGVTSSDLTPKASQMHSCKMSHTSSSVQVRDAILPVRSQLTGIISTRSGYCSAMHRTLGHCGPSSLVELDFQQQVVLGLRERRDSAAHHGRNLCRRFPFPVEIEKCTGMKKRLWSLRLMTISSPVALPMTVCEVRLRRIKPRTPQMMDDRKRLMAKGHL